MIGEVSGVSPSLWQGTRQQALPQEGLYGVIVELGDASLPRSQMQQHRAEHIAAGGDDPSAAMEGSGPLFEPEILELDYVRSLWAYAVEVADSHEVEG
jgi:hypothetical protein